MILRIATRDKPYVVIDKRLTEDTDLTYRARGILCYLLSKPDNWKVNVYELMKDHTEGRDALRTALKELQTVGYMSKVRVCDEKGKFEGIEYIIHEQPKGRKPGPGKPSPEKPLLISNDITSNKKVTWVTPYLEEWRSKYRGDFAVTNVVRKLKKLELEHGADRLLAALKKYCSETEAQFASMNSFMSKAGSYIPVMKRKYTDTAREWQGG